MNVLVTGATTPVGIALVESLLASDDVQTVLAVGREATYPGRAHPALHYRSVDLTRPRTLHDLIWGDARDLWIDHVVHGMQHRAAHDRGRRVHAQNVESIRELLLACTDHPSIQRIVYRSFAEVYALRDATSSLLDEDAPLDFDPRAPQWLRDRVEADLTVCSHQGGPLEIVVLRCAEVLAPNTGSQLWDYLQSRVCLRPLGFDPMLNVLSVEDAAVAFGLALRSTATGVFNIPGYDTMPLSLAIKASRRADIPVPGPLLQPLYRLRNRIVGFDFRYDLNLRRFHFGGVLEGTRANEKLGYTPRTPVRWPRAWWQNVLDRVGAKRMALGATSA